MDWKVFRVLFWHEKERNIEKALFLSFPDSTYIVFYHIKKESIYTTYKLILFSYLRNSILSSFY